MSKHVQQRLMDAAQHERMAKLLVRLSEENEQQAADLQDARDSQEQLQQRLVTFQDGSDSSKKRTAAVVAGTEQPTAKRAKMAEH